MSRCANPEERYAGGKYAMQSDATDTLLTYAADDQPLRGQDVVTWFTAGFHHIPRIEDWPVMSTEWKTIHSEPGLRLNDSQRRQLAIKAKDGCRKDLTRVATIATLPYSTS